MSLLPALRRLPAEELNAEAELPLDGDLPWQGTLPAAGLVRVTVESPSTTGTLSAEALVPVR